MRKIVAAAMLLALGGCDRSRDLIVDADGPWEGGYFDRMGSHFLSGPAGETRFPVRKRGNVCFVFDSPDSTVTIRVRVEGGPNVAGVEDFPAFVEGPQARGCIQ